MSALRRLPIMLAVLVPAQPLLAKGPEADPAAYLQTFTDTCRRGFPDLDIIAKAALATGWTERSMQPTDGTADIFSATLPRAFGKGDMMLFLTVPQGGEFQAICQVTGTNGTNLAGRDIAAMLTPSLKVGEPVPGPGNPREDDFALWTVRPGLTVRAGISVYRKKTRTISITARQAR